MFSDTIAALKKEAEKVNEANLIMLQKSNKSVEVMSGAALKENIGNSGAAIATTGAAGIWTIAASNAAAANLAAGIGTTGMMSTLSTTLMGLGTVGVGAAAIPVATVIAVGALTVGGTLLLASKLLKVDYEKAFNIENNHIDEIRGSTGIGDWIKGAKNIVVRGIKDVFISKDIVPPEVAVLKDTAATKILDRVDKANSFNVFDDYDVSDHLDYQKGKDKLVDRIVMLAASKFGVNLDPEQTHKALGQSRGDAAYSGKILAVNEVSGLVLQSTGRGHATIHNLRDFANIPEVGQDINVIYKGGQLLAGKVMEHERTASLGR
jgi:hypothetical protein